MNYKNLVLLLLKIMLDVVSRILIFSAWMCTDNDGQFCTYRTVLFYYGTFLLLFIFNSIFDSNGSLYSLRKWIGVFLNSLNSVLSFNNLDFPLVLEGNKNEREDKRHESTFVKQTLYFILVFMINIG